MFAEVYQMLFAWQPGSLYFDPVLFPASQGTAEWLSSHSAGDFLYYSFVTLCTVGYGDVTPASPSARFLSLTEALIGIMYGAMMVERFVAIHTAESRGAGPEQAETPPARESRASVKRAAKEKEGNQ